MRVSRIQRFSTEDGPGIRSTVFFQGCNLACLWCHNPETRPKEPPAAEGQTAGMSVREVMDILLEDMPFYLESGGGVTLSGGEPLLQPSACKGLAEACKAEGLHVIIDTAGDVPFEHFYMLLSCTDCFYYDLKTADPFDCSHYTGGNFTNIIENLGRLTEYGAQVRVRIPVIPGLSEHIDHLKGIRALGLTAGVDVDQMDLLPFHRMGSGKYIRMGLSYAYEKVEPVSEQKIKELRRAFYERES